MRKHHVRSAASRSLAAAPAPEADDMTSTQLVPRVFVRSSKMCARLPRGVQRKGFVVTGVQSLQLGKGYYPCTLRITCARTPHAHTFPFAVHNCPFNAAPCNRTCHTSTLCTTLMTCACAACAHAHTHAGLSFARKLHTPQLSCTPSILCTPAWLAYLYAPAPLFRV